MDRATLREILSEHFSSDELQTLCFDLNIDFENLGGQSKQAKARDYIAHCERNSRISELVMTVRRLRPKLSLSDERPIGLVSGPTSAAEHPTRRNCHSTCGCAPRELELRCVCDRQFSVWMVNSVGFVPGVSSAYEARVIPRDDGNGSCVVFWNRHATQTEFGSLMQRCAARHLAGKAIRLEAEIKTAQVELWAGMWLRADGEVVPDLVFDNMDRRPIRGTTPWRKYIIDVHLPNETVWLNYGIVLSGRGTMWADDFRLMVWTHSGKWADV